MSLTYRYVVHFMWTHICNYVRINVALNCAALKILSKQKKIEFISTGIQITQKNIINIL